MKRLIQRKSELNTFGDKWNDIIEDIFDTMIFSGNHAYTEESTRSQDYPGYPSQNEIETEGILDLTSISSKYDINDVKQLIQELNNKNDEVVMNQVSTIMSSFVDNELDLDEEKIDFSFTLEGNILNFTGEYFK